MATVDHLSRRKNHAVINVCLPSLWMLITSDLNTVPHTGINIWGKNLVAIPISYLGIYGLMRLAITVPPNVINASINNPDNKVHGTNRGPPGSYRSQMGPMLAPWTLLSGKAIIRWDNIIACLQFQGQVSILINAGFLLTLGVPRDRVRSIRPKILVWFKISRNFFVMKNNCPLYVIKWFSVIQLAFNIKWIQLHQSDNRGSLAPFFFSFTVNSLRHSDAQASMNES